MRDCKFGGTSNKHKNKLSVNQVSLYPWTGIKISGHDSALSAIVDSVTHHGLCLIYQDIVLCTKV